MKLTALLVLAVLPFSIPTTAQTKQSDLGRGGEWLSWHPEQRQGYVWGYIGGNMEGTYTSCALADELYETDKPHTLGHARESTDETRR
jgi:hypothetical protein